MKYVLFLMFVFSPVSLFAQTALINISDENGNPVENAIVSLMSADKSKNFNNRAKSNPVMVQEGQEFIPRVLPVRVGSDVNFPNKDNFRHMIYSFSKAKRFEVQLYGGEDQISVNFDKTGTVILGCNIHDNMVGYIYVVETDHFAKSDATGNLEITDLEPGIYEATIWHPNIAPNFKNITQEITITAENLTQIEFPISLK